MNDQPLNFGPQTNIGQDNSDGTMRAAVLNILKQLSQLTLAMTNAFPPVRRGTCRLGAAAATTVLDTAVTATGRIILFPTSASAATLTGSAGNIYVSAQVAGTSFTVSTANAAAAAGTETFSYVVYP